MSVPITIEAHNGHFTAAVLGAPDLQGTGPTRDEALTSLRALIAERVQHGNLLFADVEPKGVSALAGIWADDPTAREMVEEIYRARDAEPYE